MEVQVEVAKQFLLEKGFKGKKALVLGTGLGAVAKTFNIVQSIRYQEIPDFPVSKINFQRGVLHLTDTGYLIFEGRLHYYEGHSMAEVVFPILLANGLGVEQILMTNAVGGLQESQNLGDVYICTDHISLFLPENPLRAFPTIGLTFPDLRFPFCSEAVKMLTDFAIKKQINLGTGIFVWVQGPSLESAYEYHVLRSLGADLVGMSTTPEVIMAAAMGMKVTQLSVVTDLAHQHHSLSLDQVKQASATALPYLSDLIDFWIRN